MQPNEYGASRSRSPVGQCQDKDRAATQQSLRARRNGERVVPSVFMTGPIVTRLRGRSTAQPVMGKLAIRSGASLIAISYATRSSSTTL